MPTSDKNWNEWSIKVLEQLVALSKDYEELDNKIQTNYTQLNKSLEETASKIDKINELLNGNGNPEKGLVIRTDRLEQNEQRRTWLLRTTIVSCIGAIVATIMNWLKH